MSQSAGESSQKTMKRERPRLLALDGGGVRGWSQIFLLGNIIREIKVAANDPVPEDEDLFPCDYFELVIGTGTGGANALMIGRLGMSIPQIKKAYKDLQSEVFETIEKSTYNYKDVDSHTALFDYRKLETWAKGLAALYAGHEDARLIPDKKDKEIMEKKNMNHWGNTNNRGCKMCVTSMRTMNITFPALFRSYLVRANRETNCTIWEALRATTAAPLHFPPIKIGDIPIARPTYMNAELGANNPIKLLHQEFEREWKKPAGKAYSPTEPGVIISLGTGKENVISLKEYRPQDKDSEQKLYNAYLRMAKDCELAHQDFGRGLEDRPDDEKIYFRFNVEQGLQNIADLDWGKSQEVMTQVNIHMQHEEYGPAFEEVAEQYKRLEEEEKRNRDEEARIQQEQAASETRAAEAAAVAEAIARKRG